MDILFGIMGLKIVFLVYFNAVLQIRGTHLYVYVWKIKNLLKLLNANFLFLKIQGSMEPKTQNVALVINECFVQRNNL